MFKLAAQSGEGNLALIDVLAALAKVGPASSRAPPRPLCMGLPKMRLTSACDLRARSTPPVAAAKAYRAARDSEAAHALYSWLYQISKMAAAQDAGLDASTICGAEARRARGRCCHTWCPVLCMGRPCGWRWVTARGRTPGVLPPPRRVRRLLLRLGQVETCPMSRPADGSVGRSWRSILVGPARVWGHMGPHCIMLCHHHYRHAVGRSAPSYCITLVPIIILILVMGGPWLPCGWGKPETHRVGP
jgi:hypothetical protein